METVIAVLGVVVVVLDGFDMFKNSTPFSITVACIMGVCYLLYTLSKRFKEPDSKNKREIVPEPSEEPDPEPPKKDLADLSKYSVLPKPVSTEPRWNAELNQAHRLYVNYGNDRKRGHVSIRLCYDSFNVDLSLFGCLSPSFNKDAIDRYPEFGDAYRRAGSPPLDQPYVYTAVSCNSKPNSDGTRLYIPKELKCRVVPGTDLVSATQQVEIELNHLFNSKPCYFFQYA